MQTLIVSDGSKELFYQYPDKVFMKKINSILSGHLTNLQIEHFSNYFVTCM